MSDQISIWIDETCEDLLGISEDRKPKEYWVERGVVPLMYRRRNYYDYKNPKTMATDTIGMNLNLGGVQQSTPINLLVLASTGWGKTRLVKNVIKQCYKCGYKILVIEPKSFEFLNMKYKGHGNRIAPFDTNESIKDAVSYTPYFAREFLAKWIKRRLASTKFYSPDISLLDYPDAWIGMGVPLKAANKIVGEIKKGNLNMQKWVQMLRYEDLHTMTRQAAITTLEGLQEVGFFNSRFKDIDLEKEWADDKIVVINYHNQRNGFMLSDLGLLLSKVMRIGQVESNQGLQNVTKKLIVFDDLFYYGGGDATRFNKTTDINMAAANIGHCQNNARAWGVNSVVVVQNLNHENVYENIIDGCTAKMIGSCENVNYLRGKIPEDAFNLVSNTSPERGPVLYSDEVNYVKQWVFSTSRTKYDTGMVYDCTLGHTG